MLSPLPRNLLALGAATFAVVLLADHGSAAATRRSKARSNQKPASASPATPTAAGEKSASANTPPVLSDRGVDAADRIQTKVVVVRTAQADHHGYATGFLAGPGLVLTSAQAVKGLTSAVTWVNGVAYSATVAALHPSSDVALLRLRAPELLLKPAVLAESTRGLTSDEELVVVTGPTQPASTDTEPMSRRVRAVRFSSEITQRNAQGKPGPVLLLRGSTERGDSGSPVVRVRDGAVVGIVIGRELADAQGVSRAAYAVPSDALSSWLADFSHATADMPSAGAPKEDFYLSRLGKQDR